MRSTLHVLPIEKTNVRRFLDFLDEDRILHIFTIYDLRFMRNKTKVWAALENDEMRGYLFEFDKRIIHTRGQTEGITELLDYISLEEPVMVIEPHHLAVIEKSFKPVEPTDASSKGKITTYLVMKTNAETFQPSIKHRFKKLEAEDLDEVSERIGEGWAKRVEDAIRRGMAFGAYERDSLASLATVPEIIEDIAFVRGVYTVPSLRSKGLATSATSALIEELISLDKEAILWVAKANTPARKVYEKIGFRKTGQVLLGFKARRL